MITVIVPIYNREKYLEKCVNSILAQTYKDLEILLIDDGSHDKSLEICNSFEKIDERIKVISKKNTGVSDTRNYGINIAKGDYLAFVDSDDYIDKEMYEELLKSMINDVSDISFCKYKRISEEGNLIENVEEKNLIKLFNNPKDIEYFFDYDERNIMGSIWRSIFKKNIINENNISFDKNIFIEEDLIFVLTYLKYCNKISIINKHYYNYLNNSSSITNSRYKPNYFNNCKLLFKQKCNIINESKLDSFTQKKVINKLKFYLAIILVNNELNCNDFINSIKIISNDDFFSKLLTLSALFSALITEHSLKNKLYFILIKLRMWKVIRLHFIKRNKCINSVDDQK